MSPSPAPVFRAGDRVRVVDLDTPGRVVAVWDGMVTVDLRDGDRVSVAVESVEHVD